MEGGGRQGARMEGGWEDGREGAREDGEGGRTRVGMEGGREEGGREDARGVG